MHFVEDIGRRAKMEVSECFGDLSGQWNGTALHCIGDRETAHRRPKSSLRLTKL
jgi:hypothetical protein